MFSKLSKGDRVFTVMNYLLLCLIIGLMIYPLIYVVSASLSNPERMLLGELWLFPKDLTFESYRLAFTNPDIWIGYRNTIFYTVLGTVINLTMSLMIAYPLSRKDFYGRGMITAFIIFTMFFNGGMIPTFLLVRDLGMLNTVWAVMIPGAVSVYNVIIMRTFFQGIPEEIREAASIDGSTNLHFLWKIVLPLSTPIIAVMALFYGVGHWNAFFDALIYLQDSQMYPLQLFLRQMLIQDDMTALTTSGTDGVAQHILRVEGLKYSLVLIASLPMLIVYPFLQKFFIKGVMIGSLKG